ncbi:MAG: HAMP domain-containing protein [Anaerolineae bacterium]|nr:MAG: HAMP domain-containing protein [Anaerolineae bacterium]
MSLRTRLTLLYSTLVGGILLFFGFAVYQVVGQALVRQVDDLLARTAQDMIAGTRYIAMRGLVFAPDPGLEVAANLYVQLWGGGSELVYASPSIRGLDVPLAPLDRMPERPVYRTTVLRDVNLRVLSVPLVVGRRLVGTLQVATNLDIVRQTQRLLLVVLGVGTLIAVLVAAVVVSLTTRQALVPLQQVKDIALQITRADDLSRRIPYHGPPEDEIGQLIRAFNQTLGRLEDLFQSQRRFLADVSHELRTPLTVIKGNVNLLRRMGCADQDSLASIEGEVDRLTRMIGDLLLIARMEAGRLPLAEEDVELDTLLLEVLEQSRVLAADKVSLKLVEIDRAPVRGDRDRLKQVILNLVENAIKYTPQGGEVSVRLCRQEGQACLSVQDTGPGIPPQDLPHIFERFYRAEKARTRSADGKGFGLGLSIAYWIVQRHGGTITVESSPGQGTRFDVFLPLAEEG